VEAAEGESAFYGKDGGFTLDEIQQWADEVGREA
jgi:hypothetical protein